MLAKIRYSVLPMVDYEAPHSRVVEFQSVGVLCGSAGAQIQAPEFSVDYPGDIEF